MGVAITIATKEAVSAPVTARRTLYTLKTSVLRLTLKLVRSRRKRLVRRGLISLRATQTPTLILRKRSIPIQRTNL